LTAQQLKMTGAQSL